MRACVNSMRFAKCFRYHCHQAACAFVALCVSAHGIPKAQGVLANSSAPVAMDVDSGIVTSGGVDPAIVFSEVIEATGSAWLRLKFDEVLLAGGPGSDDASYLIITSLADGGRQTMHAWHAAQFQNTSAYFNGDRVRLEIFAYPQTGPNRVRVSEVIAGFDPPAQDGPQPRTLCGATDDRQLSNDPRAARVVVPGSGFDFVGTVFLVNDVNHCFVTSGQNANEMDGSEIIEFNAPLTFPNGTTLNHPPPEDQYVVDPASIQFQSSGTANNWGYFGCFPNSTSGLTPYETQGAAFDLAAAPPAPASQAVEVFGNGSTTPPVFRTWSFVLKSEVGTYVGLSGTQLSFVADLTFGDSGAPVVDVSTGEVIGIATGDGCTAGGGANVGTTIDHPGLQAAINNPTGVCTALVFQYPNGFPAFVHPAGGTSFPVIVSGANGVLPQPGTGQLHYDEGQGYMTVPMVETSPNVYDAVFPALECGAFVDFYVSAETSGGVRFPDQLDNPTNTQRTVAATSVSTVVEFDFESGAGFDVQNVNLTDGQWQRGVPSGGSGAPSSDFDGSGQCWLTGVAGGSDVDGGPTVLRSPTINLASANKPYLSYARWFTNDDQDIDRLTVEMSQTSGFFWTSVESVADTPGWVEARFDIGDYVALTTGFRVRFVVSDQPNNSITEAAIDAFTILDYECDSIVCLKGDVNGDTFINGGDIAGFATAMLGPATPGSLEFCSTDMDDDGSLETADDLSLFVSCLVTGTCP